MYLHFVEGQGNGESENTYHDFKDIEKMSKLSSQTCDSNFE